MAADQCRLDNTVNYVANISSSAQPTWYHDHLHAAASGAGSHLSASSWPYAWQSHQQQQQQQPNPNSNSSCEEDVSNHSSLSVDSSRRLIEQRSTSSNDDLSNIGEHVSDNQIWSQVLLSDVGTNGLNMTNPPPMYEHACDYLNKLDNGNSNNNNWEFTNSSSPTANMHASNLNNFERQININRSFSNENLSNLVSTTWSIAPPEPQVVVSNPFFNLPNHQASCYGGEYPIGLNNADNAYYVIPFDDSYSSSNTSARSVNDVIYFNSRLGKPALMEHTHHHVENPSSFKSSINLSSDSTSKKPHASPMKTSRRGQVSGNESAGRKKRTEESSTSSETVSKKPKQESSASSIKMDPEQPKVKVADKVTALQQIVSPFGKTDTASVLYEAIQYIKFLQDQIHVLASSPYLKTNSNKDPWGKFDNHVKLDLKSRGLCLVPTSFTTLPQVLENSGSDYWTPTYRGCLYR